MHVHIIISINVHTSQSVSIYASEFKSRKHAVNSKFDYKGILQPHHPTKPDPPAKPDYAAKPDCPPKPGGPAKPDHLAMQQAHETSSTSITSMDTSEVKVLYMDSNHSDYLPDLMPPCNSETTDTSRTKLCESLNSTPGSICGPFDCSTPNRGIT